MNVIPSIDLMKGKVVRLSQGDPERATVYGSDATKFALKYQEIGADALHLVDLDATLSRGNNIDTIEKIRKNVTMSIQVGGGIRGVEHAQNLLSIGIDRLVIGTVALEKRELLKEILAKAGKNRIVVALDYRGDEVVTRGWTKGTGLKLLDTLKDISALGSNAFLLTAVERDGMLVGPDIDTLKRAKQTSKSEIQASGGVSSIKDVEELLLAGIDSVIIGRALYEQRINLADAIAITKRSVKAK